MSVSLDNLARELMCWFGSKTSLADNAWEDESDLVKDFSTYLSYNSSVKVLNLKNEDEVLDNSHLIIYANDEKDNEGLIAKFMIDGKKNTKEINDEILNTALILNSNNLNKNLHSATKCVVSVYTDLKNRSKFHEVEFIEIYQQYGIGCAIKRLK